MQQPTFFRDALCPSCVDEMRSPETSALFRGKRASHVADVMLSVVSRHLTVGYYVARGAAKATASRSSQSNAEAQDHLYQECALQHLESAASTVRMWGVGSTAHAVPCPISVLGTLCHALSQYCKLYSSPVPYPISVLHKSPAPCREGEREGVKEGEKEGEKEGAGEKEREGEKEGEEEEGHRGRRAGEESGVWAGRRRAEEEARPLAAAERACSTRWS
eukprot:3825403-Rhodomonas_salina.1